MTEKVMRYRKPEYRRRNGGIGSTSAVRMIIGRCQPDFAALWNKIGVIDIASIDGAWRSGRSSWTHTVGALTHFRIHNARQRVFITRRDARHAWYVRYIV